MNVPACPIKDIPMTSTLFNIQILRSTFQIFTGQRSNVIDKKSQNRLSFPGLARAEEYPGGTEYFGVINAEIDSGQVQA